jgi:hypothetical protein
MDLSHICKIIEHFLNLLSFNHAKAWLDVRCSMFFFFSEPSTVFRRKNKLALMGYNPQLTTYNPQPPTQHQPNQHSQPINIVNSINQSTSKLFNEAWT